MNIKQLSERLSRVEVVNTSLLPTPWTLTQQGSDCVAELKDLLASTFVGHNTLLSAALQTLVKPNGFHVFQIKQ